MALFQFRLQALLDRRLEEKSNAEEALAATEKELAMEQRTMKALEEEASRAEALYRSKRMERATSGVNGGSSLAGRSARLAGLQLDVHEARASILSQQVFIDQATDAVREARKEAEARRGDVNVLEKYRQKAEAKFLQEEAYREELEQDEIGNVMHLSRRAHK